MLVDTHCHLGDSRFAGDRPAVLGRAAAVGVGHIVAIADSVQATRTAIDLARAALHGEGKGIPIFLGLNDEGLAVDGGSFLRPGDEPVVAQLEKFNRTQDYEILRSVRAR